MGRKAAVPSIVLVHPARRTRVVINQEQGYLLVNRPTGDGDCPTMQPLSDFRFVTPDLMIRFYERRGFVDRTGARLCVEPGCVEPQYVQPGGARMSRCKAHYAAYQLKRYHAKKHAKKQGAEAMEDQDE